MLSEGGQGGRPALPWLFPGRSRSGEKVSREAPCQCGLSSTHCALEGAIHAPSLASAPLSLPPPIPSPSLVLNTLVTVGVPRDLGRQPASAGIGRKGLQAWGPPRGERTPSPHATRLLGPETWPAVRWSLLTGLGALRKSRPGYAPPLNSSGPDCGRDGSFLLSDLGGCPRPSRVPGTISSSGRRRDTGRGERF